MRCPNLDEITAATLALLPRGRAWQTNEGSFNDPKSVLWQFWRSFAAVIDYLTQRLCALRLEFWCQSISETRDGWMKEYGLPDECDPFPDLCTKVAAIGGTQCSYYAEIARRAGWSIACIEREAICGLHLGFSRAGHSATIPGRLGDTQLVIIVYLNESPSYVAPRTAPVLSGRFLVGRRMRCENNFEPLRCVLSRVVHAHITLIFQPSA